MNTMQLTYKHSHKTLWLGLAGALVVIVGSLLFGHAQTQKKEGEKMNPTKSVPGDAELRVRPEDHRVEKIIVDSPVE